ncbi:hypothetical protein CCHR01_18431 [Colletotrichum chrysophilum]|uniref:Uncharacterized protein n=1 Tax=Colletotrichum chrysophilum TaxID=1836956 RepID=A0AAD9A0E0_9PEZI|nr:hypothetical protein CCHR01_18431 [Colletotrichum chrysophilum]
MTSPHGGAERMWRAQVNAHEQLQNWVARIKTFEAEALEARKGCFEVRSDGHVREGSAEATRNEKIWTLHEDVIISIVHIEEN